jgi:hypothetical protein
VYFFISVGKGTGPFITASCFNAVSIICLTELSSKRESLALTLMRSFEVTSVFLILVTVDMDLNITLI